MKTLTIAATLGLLIATSSTTMCGKTEDERSMFDPEKHNPMKKVPKEYEDALKTRSKHLDKSLKNSGLDENLNPESSDAIKKAKGWKGRKEWKKRTP